MSRHTGLTSVLTAIAISGCHREWPVQVRAEYSAVLASAAILSDSSVVAAGTHAGALSMCGTTEGKLGESAAFLVHLSRTGRCDWVDHKNSHSGVAAAAVVAGMHDEVYWAGDECLDCEVHRSFLERVDAGGRTVWTFTLSGTEPRLGSLALGPAGPVIAGTFSGALEIGTAKLNSVGPGAAPDIFIIQLDSSGGVIWLAQLGGKGGDSVGSIAVLPSGEVLATGDIAPATACERPPGPIPESEAFLAGFRDGHPSRCVSLRSSTNQSAQSGRSRGNALAISSSGMAAIVGTYSGQAGIAGMATTSGSSREARDAQPDDFAAVYGPDFKLRWARQLEVAAPGKPIAATFDGEDLLIAVERPAVLLRLDHFGVVRRTWVSSERDVALNAVASNSCGTAVVVGDGPTAIDAGAVARGSFVDIVSRNGSQERRICRP